MHHLFLTAIRTVSSAPTLNDDMYNLMWILISIGVVVICVVLAILFNRTVSHEHQFTWREVSQCLYDGECKCGAKTREVRHSWVVKEQDVVDDGGWRSTHVRYKSCARCGKSEDL
jgi:hypothetical protein